MIIAQWVLIIIDKQYSLLQLTALRLPATQREDVLPVNGPLDFGNNFDHCEYTPMIPSQPLTPISTLAMMAMINQ